jgi:hypothetical protein
VSVVNGQPANATVFNGAFVSRTSNTSTVGVLTLNNTSVPASGAQITNAQRYINELASVLGVLSEGDGSANTYASVIWVINGQDRKAAIESLDLAFDPTTGHDHDGLRSKKISAANLENINYYRADWQLINVDGASGATYDISAEMTGRVPGGTATQIGVATDPPYNQVEIREKLTGTYIEDAGGQRVYGRITEASGVWTLSFFTNEAGVETAHTLAAYDLAVSFREVFTLDTLPTFSSDLGILSTFDLTNDLIYATDTIAGKVLLSNAPPPPDGVAAVGTSTAVAREDHVHAIREPIVEYRTLTGGEATAKQLTLSSTPLTASNVMVDAIGGGAQMYGVDYTVTGAVLDWSGLGLDSIPLVAGDILRIMYWSV